LEKENNFFWKLKVGFLPYRLKRCFLFLLPLNRAIFSRLMLNLSVCVKNTAVFDGAFFAASPEWTNLEAILNFKCTVGFIANPWLFL